jgi:hypothetical protein
MTSIARETGREDLTLVHALPDVANAFGTTFQRDIDWRPRDILPQISIQSPAP